MSHRRLATLTGIRGAAASWVVVFHAYPVIGRLLGLPMRWQVPIVRDGFLAVDLFFVLSGFVLSLAYHERFRMDFRSGLGEFFFGRVCRIFPLHWFCLGIFVLLFASFPHHRWGPGPFTLKALMASAALVQNWDRLTALAWNHPTWSLSAEWVAYLLFPALTFVVGLLNDRRLALGGALLSLAALDAFLIGANPPGLDHVGPIGIVRCLCEFFAGALAWKAVWAERRNHHVAGEACTALGATLLALAVAIPRIQLVAPLAFVLLVVGCAMSSRIADWLFGNRIIVFLGRISFSIYLVHIIVVASLALVIDRFHMEDADLSARLVLTIALPLLVVAAAYFTWRFVERPSQRFSYAHSHDVAAWTDGVAARALGVTVRAEQDPRSSAGLLDRPVRGSDEPAHPS